MLPGHYPPTSVHACCRAQRRACRRAHSAPAHPKAVQTTATARKGVTRLRAAQPTRACSRAPRGRSAGQAGRARLCACGAHRLPPIPYPCLLLPPLCLLCTPAPITALLYSPAHQFHMPAHHFHVAVQNTLSLNPPVKAAQTLTQALHGPQRAPRAQPAERRAPQRAGEPLRAVGRGAAARARRCAGVTRGAQRAPLALGRLAGAGADMLLTAGCHVVRGTGEKFPCDA